ncbi:U2 small nuclear ribonucleoprotein B''-like protein [Zopfochytrium polystomum]|nr:U2 small nuclear ribonucleoprotein B''-like protein [Zopfochytrium polystomum]
MAATGNLKPSQTLYVKGVVGKIGKIELRKNLYHLFSRFGLILDVVVVKREDTRGQAFIVFKETANATNALRSMQGYVFMDKALRIEYAKGKSKAVAVLEGKYDPPKKTAARAGPQKRMREEEDDEDEGDASERKKAAADSRPDEAEEEDMEEDMEQDSEPDDADSGPAKPHHILFLTSLPSKLTKTVTPLSDLFRQYPGFREVRLVPGKSEIAFVEFSTAALAEAAKKGLDGFEVDAGVKLAIQFSKM